MFLLRRPSDRDVAAFLEQSRDLPLSYGPIGLAEQSPSGYDVDELTVTVGRGDEAFERAKRALARWMHFDLGWVSLFPRHAPSTPDSVVAVRVFHLGFWSLNACRVLYAIGDREVGSRYGFAYGTLVNHGEAGEEIFEVSIDPVTGVVHYRLRAVSRPRALLARAGYPLVRRYQARFRRDSAAAMQRV